MKIFVKRVYEAPEPKDGVRILVDRLWPRGVSKKEVGAEAWAKELAPSAALRTWLHKDPEKRFKEFAAKYRKELAKRRAEARELVKGKTAVTLVTAVKDIEHSHVPVLLSFLKKL